MKILLPVDGSENALEAVRHALRLVDDGLRASFVLANVQEPASLYEVMVAHDAEVIEQVSAAAAAHSLAPAQALLGVAGLGFETEVYRPACVIANRLEIGDLRHRVSPSSMDARGPRPRTSRLP